MTFELELYATDFVLLKNGEPMEGVDIIYDQGFIDELYEHGFTLQEGEQFVAMSNLPSELQDKYRASINKYRGEFSNA